MSTYDSTSPAQSHNTLDDVAKIRTNSDALRDNESSAEASPPSNPVAGQFWHTSDTEKVYLRTNAGAWLYLFRASDIPAKSSDLTTHTSANITPSSTVHGIRQGSGNGLDADTVDGYHASSFLQTSHGTASSGVHGAGSGVLLSAPTNVPFLVIASTAPTGWTQNASWNDRVIRIVSGTGGGTGGAWSISGLSMTSEGAHTHSVPSHTHSVSRDGWGVMGGYVSGRMMTSNSSTATAANDNTTGAWGGTTGTGSSHAHSLSQDGTWRPSYLDVIAVTKNA